MGMAASQARFLGLTARKSNTEFEGQQVNQQRTTLANQSANYYNQLLGMTVPTPPSTSDFTKTVYTFEDGNLSNSITSLIAKPNGLYLASYVSSWTNDYTPVNNGSAILTRMATASTTYPLIEKYENAKLYEDVVNNRWQVVDSNDNTVIYANNLVKGTDDIVRNISGDIRYVEDSAKKIVEARSEYDYSYASGSTNLRILGSAISATEKASDPYFKTLSPTQLDNLIKEEKQYETMLNEKYGEKGDQWLVKYIQNTSSGVFEPVFYKKDVVDKAVYNENGISQSNIQSYRMGSATETEEIKGKYARLEKDSTGRYINITLYDDEKGNNPVTYSLTTNTITDQAAYDDAMNQYEYNKYQYEQEMQDINAKIEIIQTQDKNLELRLKQLDTEQEAIQTEMESLTKVVDKNIEKSFNSFA